MKLFGFACMLLLSQILGFSQEEKDLVKAGQHVPEFSFQDSEGNIHAISDYKGKVVLINFFATWCGPCKKEFPSLEKELWDKYKNKGLVVLSFGRGHNWDEIKKFNNGMYSFPMYPDPERKVFDKFAEKAIPRNYVVDKNGKIIHISIGFTHSEFREMVLAVKKALKE